PGQTSIGIEVSKLGGLCERRAAAVIPATEGETVAGREPIAPSGLARQPIVVLRRLAAIEKPIAFPAGFIVQEHVRNAPPKRERRVGRLLAAGRKAGVPRRRQRTLLR